MYGHRTSLSLALVCALAAIPLLYFGATYYIEYDGYWHVFIAKQTWSNFLVEYQATAHPPLFFVLLRGALAIGDSRLIYRLVSIFSALGAIFLMGRNTLRLTGSGLTAVLAAFVFGISESTLLVALEVRSYALCVFFALAAFSYYLDIVDLEIVEHDWKARVGFSVNVTLAILSHYSALIFFAACVAAPLLLAAGNPEYRSRFLAFLRARPLAILLTVLPPTGIGLGLFVSQARTFAAPLGYLAPYYFHPGREPRLAFLLRTLKSELKLFSPVGFAAVLFVLCAIAAVVSCLIGIYGRGSRNFLTAISAAVFFLMSGVFMAAGVAGKYPFGGELRHQYLLFPFLVLSGFALLDRSLTLLSAPRARVALLSFGLLAAALNARAEYVRFPNVRSDHATSDVAMFRSLFPRPDVVLVDQFNAINFFTHYADWRWRTVERDGYFYMYAVSKGDSRFTVIRDRSVWNFDFAELPLYGDIKRALLRTSARSITVFYMDQFGTRVPHRPDEERTFRERVRTLASRAGLEAERLSIDGQDVYGAFHDSAAGSQTGRDDAGGPVLLSVDPRATAVGDDFVVQPNGYSAISVAGANFERGAVLLANGRSLETTFGNPRWLTAIFPRDLYSAAGAVRLQVRNADGRTSNSIDFVVKALAPSGSKVATSK
jgi:hypothetical protein